MAIHRTTVRLWTHIAQLFCVVALAMAAIVIMAPRAQIQPPTPALPDEASLTDESPPADSASAEQDADSPALERHDWTQLAGVIDSIRKPMEGQAASAATDAADTKTADAAQSPRDPASADQPAPKPAPPGWRYVGYAITSGGEIVGLVDMNSKQQFVSKGATLDAFVVVEVDLRRLLIERDGRRFEMKLLAKTPFDPTLVTSDARGRARIELERNRNLQQDRTNQMEMEIARRRAAGEERAPNR